MGLSTTVSFTQQANYLLFSKTLFHAQSPNDGIGLQSQALLISGRLPNLPITHFEVGILNMGIRKCMKNFDSGL